MAYLDDDYEWDLYAVPESINPLPLQDDVSPPSKFDGNVKTKALIEPSTSRFDENFKIDASIDPSTSRFDENIKIEGLVDLSTSSGFDDEDSRIKALVNTPALDWLQQSSSGGFGSGRGMRGGRMMGGRGFGRRGGLVWRRPPEGYVCQRCKVGGHFIQHCPTNGDPAYDIKRVKPPTGIPKSMLMENPGGFYRLPSGDAAVLRPDEAAFKREIEGLPSTRGHVGDVPRELYCHLCKKVMKFAVLSSKCCFQSFCDECIRGYIISKSMCVCGAKDVLADDLLPNLTLRKTINRIMESSEGRLENGGSASQVQDMESNNLEVKVPPSRKKEVAMLPEVEVRDMQLKNLQAKVPSSMQFMASSKEEVAEEVIACNDDPIGVTHESVRVKEPTLQSVPLADKECEVAKKKKRKKDRMPSDAAEMQWNAAQNLAAKNYMRSMAFAACAPYWTGGVQPGMAGFVTPYAGALPYTGFGFGVSPVDMQLGCVLPQDQFARPQLMSRNRVDFEAGKPLLKRKHEAERWESSKDQGLDRVVSSSCDISTTMKTNSVIPSRSSTQHHRHLSKRPLPDHHKQDYNDDKPHRRHRDEHYQFQDNIRQHNHRHGHVDDCHYSHRRHDSSVQTCH